jgi:hypothetical protein
MTRSYRDRSNIITLAGYYSITYDVITFTGDDDDYCATVIAEFKSREDAYRYVERNDNEGSHVRPPAQCVRDAADWIAIVANPYCEGITVVTHKTPHPEWMRDELTCDEMESFDVTCVIGTVHVTHDGTDMPPHHAAFLLIAEHNAEGEYVFPYDGGTCHVDVAFRK